MVISLKIESSFEKIRPTQIKSAVNRQLLEKPSLIRINKTYKKIDQ